ncbi:carboxypeptidase-like regulatory domain-containing protein [Streptomyces sp. NBC_01465]|uniref:carboxypeptidase-like regulatory domain-containing protein n=1 Tax=Streptomyces sp. NBC_01465 TaxID=2903878 RepID=UPI002E354C20|nr:carboxypeptidase-like regulatory domain-containing protein [Streptomyces sp. NBC_01465]
MGLQFGHRLGLPVALCNLPVAPLVEGYRELAAEQRALGLRHVADAFAPRGARFQVLDGVFVPRGRQGRGWQRVDGAVLRARRDEGGAAAGFLGRLVALQDADPGVLRRVLLYQLVALLQGGQDAVDLGVDDGEAAALAHAARMLPVLTDEQRRAAEGLQDAWAARRLRRAERLAGQLAGVVRQDPWLARRLKEIAGAVRAADLELREARVREHAGDLEGAGARFLRVARLAGDDRRALRGLVRVHAGGEELRTRLGADSVELSWPRTPGVEAWRVCRLTRAEGRPPVVAEVAARVTDGALVDRRAALGSEVRYAALPLRGGVVDGPPVVSAALLFAPEVAGLRVSDGRERLEADWQSPPGAAAVTVTLTGPDGSARTVDAESGRCVVRGLGVGAYRLRVRCRYRTAEGLDVDSPGVEAGRTVHAWPEPVDALKAEARDGGVRFRWTGGAGARVRLVEWAGGGVPPEGTELDEGAVPGALGWARDGDVSVPPEGSTTLVTAVAVLGERAVVGPGVLVEAVAAVGALRVERDGAGAARVAFDWPGNAGQVTVVREQDGERAEFRVARSVFLREGLRVPVSAAAVRFRAAAAARAAGAVVVEPGAAAAELPADIAIAYRIVPGPRRPLRRKPATVHITLSSPDGEDALDIPEFVLVARPGEPPAPVRPRDPADGTTVLRLSGAELLRAGSVERELEPGLCRTPYALRGFLLGGRAASVRLEEPSPSSLVVR